MKHGEEVLQIASGGAEISAAFAEIGVRLSRVQLDRFQVYQTKLRDWNRRAGLISRNDEARILERHLLESGALIRFEELRGGRRVLDLGTGGGFPGLPLKILNPDMGLTLLDSRRWKCLFLKDLVESLELEGASIVCERAEAVGARAGFTAAFDVVVSRAVAELQTLYALAQPFMAPRSVLIAIKGRRAEDEVRGLLAQFPELRAGVEPLMPDLQREPGPQRVVFVRHSSQSIGEYGC